METEKREGLPLKGQPGGMENSDLRWVNGNVVPGIRTNCNLIAEAKFNGEIRFLNEAADLMFHYLVLLAAKETRLQEILEVLRERHQKSNPRH
jgi:hypothetical protein